MAYGLKYVFFLYGLLQAVSTRTTFKKWLTKFFIIQPLQNLDIYDRYCCSISIFYGKRGSIEQFIGMTSAWVPFATKYRLKCDLLYICFVFFLIFLVVLWDFCSKMCC